MTIEISIAVFLYMVILFLISLIREDNSTGDAGWGTGFILISVISIFQAGQMDLSKIIMNLFVLLWGARLSYYILIRSRGRDEDFRYKKYRETWKFFRIRSFFQIYMLQGLVMMVISFPIWYVNYSPVTELDFFDILGSVIFLTGFYFEIKADDEMNNFRKDPANKGKILTTGIWSLSRHPNYFGEALIWIGISFFALEYSLWWVALVSPVMMTLLLRYVSGVPLLEESLKHREGWEEYKNNTPVFFPGIKKWLLRRNG